MAYQEVTDTIVTTLQFNMYNSSVYQYDFVGIKQINTVTGEETIYEGNKVPDISIEMDEPIKWFTAIILNTETSPTSIKLECNYFMYISEAKIYLKYNGEQTNNYIYIKQDYKYAILLFYDKHNNMFVYVDPSELNIIDYPLSLYTPIAIQIVVFNTEKIYNKKGIIGSFMSLKLMSVDTPDTGTYMYEDENGNNTCMYFGLYNVNLSLTNYNVVPYIENTEECTILGTKEIILSNLLYLPIDRYKLDKTGIICLHNYNYRYSTYTKYMLPGPYYGKYSTLNPAYYLTESPSSPNNALSDFDGEGNTLILCNMATALSNWKTDSSIINSSLAGYSPAACCCLRYYTDGTNPGDWYLPTAGELGYVVQNIEMVLNSLQKIKDVYGPEYATTDLYFLHSSTNIDNNNTVIVHNSGIIYSGKKNELYQTVAFMLWDENSLN